MADNKDLKGQADRTRVAGNEPYELAYLEAKLGVSRETVKAAIAAVGNDRDKVEQYIREDISRR